MSTSESVATPRGWYPDPQQTGFERWWTGTEWSEHTARDRGPGSFGIGYVRSMRAGANAAAGRAMLFARIGLGAFLLAFVVWFMTRIDTPTIALALLFIGFAVASLVLAVIATVFGVLGLTRSELLGAKALSINALVACGSLVLLALILLLVS
jgi:hypothetical protein